VDDHELATSRPEHGINQKFGIPLGDLLGMSRPLDQIGFRRVGQFLNRARLRWL
jgi:hypothetical protein